MAIRVFIFLQKYQEFRELPLKYEVKNPHKAIISESGYSKPNLDFNYTFSIDLTPNRILFGTKLIGKVLLRSKFGLDTPDSIIQKRFLCVYEVKRSALIEVFIDLINSSIYIQDN